jgi:Domain of unknown function (DUF2017)
VIGAFTRGPGRSVAIELHSVEARLLADLFESLRELLGNDDGAGGGSTAGADPLAEQLGLSGLDDGTAAAAPRDPALARLLPDAYPEDPEASAEFRRFTRGDLTAQRRDRAETAARTLNRTSDGGRLTLQPDESAAWLGALNDLRLVLGTRLEITEDGQEPGEGLHRDDPRSTTVPIYQYLGFLQETLIEAMSG